MMSDLETTCVTWGLGLAVVATVCGLALLVSQWRRGRLIIDARQLAVRLTGGLVLLAVFCLLGFLGLWLPHHPADAARWFWPSFYGAGLLAALLVVLVLVDLRLLLGNQLRHENAFTAEILELLRSHDSAHGR